MLIKPFSFDATALGKTAWLWTGSKFRQLGQAQGLFSNPSSASACFQSELFRDKQVLYRQG